MPLTGAGRSRKPVFDLYSKNRPVYNLYRGKPIPFTGFAFATKRLILSDLDGEPGWNRTTNLLIKSQLLCQLSYGPGRGSDTN